MWTLKVELTKFFFLGGGSLIGPIPLPPANGLN